MQAQAIKIPDSGTPRIQQIDKAKQDLMENFNSIKRDCKLYEFGVPANAHRFQELAIQKAMKMLGVTRTGSYQQPLVGDKVLAEHGITMHVNSDPYQDDWQRGAYIFKDDEIVYFVSIISEKVVGPFDINRKKLWAVLTNVPLS